MNKYAAEQQFTHAPISCCRGSGLGVLDLSQTSSRIRSRLETSVMCHLGVIVFQKLCFICERLEKIDLEQTIISNGHLPPKVVKQ